MKKMNCPYCDTELENDNLWADVPSGFQCAKCGKDFDEDGQEITEEETKKKIVRVDMRDYRDIYYYDDGSVEEYRYND